MTLLSVPARVRAKSVFNYRPINIFSVFLNKRTCFSFFVKSMCFGIYEDVDEALVRDIRVM